MANPTNESIYREAHEAAVSAVREYKAKYGEPMYCGFAWVIVPGNSSFGKYLMKEDLGSKAYPKGVQVWYGDWSSSQSMDLAEAGAIAFDAVLKKHGIKSYWSSRPD